MRAKPIDTGKKLVVTRVSRGRGWEKKVKRNTFSVIK